MSKDRIYPCSLLEGENGKFGVFFAESGGGSVGWRNFMRELHYNCLIISFDDAPDNLKLSCCVVLGNSVSDDQKYQYSLTF